TNPTSARSARPVSRICRPWIFSAAATCWRISRRSSVRSISCSGRSIANGCAPPRARASAAEGGFLHGRESHLGSQRDQGIPNWPPATGGDSTAVARAGTIRRLAAAEGDRGGGRHARHGENPRTRGRDLLHDVSALAGRPQGAHPSVWNDALYA